MSELRFVRMGFGADRVEYQEAWDEQRRVHAARFVDEVPDTVLLLEHPPVYTAGRRTEDSERPLDGTPVIDVDRGGKITWHGPGQLVGYPIQKLPRPVDVVAHVRRLEEALIRTCAEFGLETSRVEGRSGVWVLGDPVEQRPVLGGLSLDFDPQADGRRDGPEAYDSPGQDEEHDAGAHHGEVDVPPPCVHTSSVGPDPRSGHAEGAAPQASNPVGAAPSAVAAVRRRSRPPRGRPAGRRPCGRRCRPG